MIDGDDFKVIKKECEDRIIRLQLELEELSAKVSHGLDMDLLVDEAINNLKNIHNFYSEADIEGKRYIAGIFYPEKWVFDGEHRTTKVNDSAMLIYHINNKLQNYKAGVKTNKSLYSGNVPLTPLYSNKFLDDLKAIANIKLFLDENHVSRDFITKYKRCYTDNESKRNSLSKLYEDDCLQLSEPKERKD